MWKKRGDINAKTGYKFNSLYQTGKLVQTKMYLRIQNIRENSFKELYKNKWNAKKDMAILRIQIKFEVRRMKKEIMKLCSLLNFIVYQLWCLRNYKTKFKIKIY